MQRCSFAGLLALAGLAPACGDSSAHVDARIPGPVVDLGVDLAIEAPADAPIDAPLVSVVDAAIDGPIDAPIDAPPPPLPDLTFVHAQMAASLRISREAFAGNACVLNECLAQPGLRRLLRFDTMVTNAGDAALVLGSPNPMFAQWYFDSCHQHYHYVDFADYTLVDAAGNVVAEGHKQAFCLRDDRIVGANASTTPIFDCSVQGLSPGWADLYAADLDCQFVDITDVLPGSYMLRIELNADRTITESNYGNNIGLFPITIPSP